MASIVTQSDQNGPKWAQNGSQKGSQKWVPQRSGPKKKIIEKYFFSGPSRPKKSPMCLFLRRKIYFWEKNLRKTIALHGVCSPPGGGPAGGCVSPPGGDCMGGVVPRKKFPKKSRFFFCPNRVINSICAYFRNYFFSNRFFFWEKKNRPTWGV